MFFVAKRKKRAKKHVSFSSLKESKIMIPRPLEESSDKLKAVSSIIEEGKANGITYGIAFMDINNPQHSFMHNVDELFEIGSMIKNCIMVEVLLRWEKNEIDLDQRIELEEAKKAVGSGIIIFIIFIIFITTLSYNFYFLFSIFYVLYSLFLLIC